MKISVCESLFSSSTHYVDFLSLSLSFSRNFEDEESLTNCFLYDNTTDKGQICPIFKLNQIIEMINENPSYDVDLATWVMHSMHMYIASYPDYQSGYEVNIIYTDSLHKWECLRGVV